MKKYKVNKGINKPIRFLGLDQKYAYYFMGIVPMLWIVLYTFLGMSLSVIPFYILPVLPIYLYFKRKDIENKAFPSEKKKALMIKPKKIKRDFGKMQEHGKLFDK
ncbi:DUF4133 domain-containing protein [Elizabethkingia ursingii]